MKPPAAHLPSIHVTSGDHYEVHIGRGILDHFAGLAGDCAQPFVLAQEPARKYADQICSMLRDAGRNPWLRIVPDAEAGKTPDVMLGHWQWLAEHGASRNATVIGVGGGACTDAAGFLAASWMRGVRFIAVPTTVAGMVDAAVGGKTGINLPTGKNLVGAFWSPSSVIADLDTLRTVPSADVRAGLAEVIKCGFIADVSIVDTCERHTAAATDVESDVFARLVAKAVQVKATVVSEDFRESNAREALNFGHTLGHAIENVEGYTWRHGDAVSVGMMFAAALQRERADSPGAQQIQDRLRNVLEALSLPTQYEGPLEPLVRAMSLDKKNRGAGPRFVLVPALGQTSRWDNVPRDALEASYGAIAS